jgi:hypothetical protein
MALSDGLYKVSFQTPLGAGYGVIVVEGSSMMGGDSSMYYVGSIDQNGDDFTAEVMAREHTSVPGMGSVFGVPEAKIILQGTSVGKKATAQGSSPDAPGVSFTATLERLH